MNRKKIFICDDDRGITEMLNTVFQLSAIEVTVENNSVLAYDNIDRIRPDVLIVDLLMPVISGDLLTKNLKNNEQLKDIFVICISASRTGQNVAMQAGADLFIAKPFDLDKITAAVEVGLNQTIAR